MGICWGVAIYVRSLHKLTSMVYGGEFIFTLLQVEGLMNAFFFSFKPGRVVEVLPEANQLKRMMSWTVRRERYL